MKKYGVDTRIERPPALPSGCRYHVEALGREVKRRVFYVIEGMSNHKEYVVYNNGRKNFCRALFERVFCVEREGTLVPTPRPRAEAFHRLAKFSRLVGDNVGVIPAVSVDEFLTRYDGRRRTIYEEAAESLKRRPYGLSDSYVNAFIKAEKVAVTPDKPDPAPRLIQPRTPRYNIEVGRRIAHMEKRIYKAIGKVFGHPTVMKGYNAHTTAKYLWEKWVMFGDPVAIDLDATRFDQHVSPEALKWEHSVYVRAAPTPEKAELAKLLSWQLVNKGFARLQDGFVKYQVQGCRMSGDMNTAMGNCLLMCAMVHAYCEPRFTKFQLANNGDDCVLIVERGELEKMADLSEWFLEMGFTMKVGKPVDVFEQIEFCQTQPVYDGSRWVMCRNPRVCMPKDCVSLLPMEQGNCAAAWMTAVGECGISLAGGIPVLQEFYCALLRGGCGHRMKKGIHMETGFFRLAKDMDRTVGEVSVSARVSFWRAFGVTPTDQMFMEDKLRAWTPGLRSSPRDSDQVLFPF